MNSDVRQVPPVSGGLMQSFVLVHALPTLSAGTPASMGGSGLSQQALPDCN